MIIAYAQSGHNIVMTVAMKVALFFTACFVFATAHPLAKSPYSACDVDTSCDDASYDLQDLKISFSPDPPQKGQNVTITASGTLNKEISGGSIKVVAKYGIITILDQNYDVCDIIKEINKDCPIPAGPLSGSVTTTIPNDAPGGKYHADITGTDQDGGKLVCGQATCDI